MDDEKYTRRMYLLMKAVQRGANWQRAIEQVARFAHEHPELNMEGEVKTYMQWERSQPEWHG